MTYEQTTISTGLNPQLQHFDLLKGMGKPVKLSEDTKEEADTSQTDPVDDSVATEKLMDTPPKSPASNSEKSPDQMWEKRYSDLRSHTDKTVNELKAQINSLTSELTAAKSSSEKLPKTEQEILEFQKKYPDLYNTIITLAAKQGNKLVEEQKKTLEELKAKAREAEELEAFKQLLKLHPDAAEIRESDMFKEWFTEQSPLMQKLISEGSINDVARALDAYKVEKGLIKTRKQKEVPAGTEHVDVKSNINPDAKTPKVWKESEIAKLKPYEYAKLEAEIDKAHREGRVLIGK